MKILIKNIEEIHSSDQKARKNQYLLIENNTIKEIGKMEDINLINNCNCQIDAAGKIMLPGLINTHTHSAMTLMRAYADDMPLDKWLQNKIWPFESKMDSEDIYWGAALGIVEMIKTGTTTFSDMYFSMDQVAKVVEESGIRAVLAEGLIEANDGEEGLQNALDFALNYSGAADNRITTMLAPHAPYTCSKDYLLKIKKLAKKNGLAVHTHLSESRKEVDDFIKKYNKSPIKYLNDLEFLDQKTLAAHCVHLVEGDLEIFKDKKVQISHNPMSNAKLANGIAPVRDYLDNNINVSLATDGVSSNNSLSLLEEARMASYLQKIKYQDPTAVNSSDLLKMLTINGAKALNLKNNALIKEGFKADLILIDIQKDSFFYPHHNNLSNLFYSADSRCIDTVIADGKILMENSELKTLDQEKIYYESEKRAKKISQLLN